jgi:beta-glucanase (GH16 family)
MKKVLLLTSLLFVFALSACNGTDTPDPECDPGEQLVDGECVPEDNEFDVRSLVTEECQHLDNIDDWQPVWCEEFDYEGLPDTDKWFYDVGGNGWGNNELQYYTSADEDNVFVSDGNLRITALREPFSGNDYTSARLITKYRGDWEYGRVEVRAQMPAGRGLWSAIWMLPTSNTYGIWPNSGEIDIMEHVGYDGDKIHGTIHTGAYNHKEGTQIGYTKTVPTAETEFHVYTMEWEPGYIELFVDGVSFGRFGYNPLFNVGTENYEAWPFDIPFHLILNIAVGGDWGGLRGVDDSIFPTSMIVDYVRVYQKDYEGMDQEAPSDVTNLSLLDSTSSTLQFMWDEAEDDVMIYEYHVFVDGEFYERSSVNAILLTDLEQDTTYNITVYAVDFAGNMSSGESVSLTTDSVPTIDTRVEAETYDAQSGVVRETTDDTTGNQHVGWIDSGDSMEYILYVPTAGTYTITYRLWSNNPGEIKFYGKTRIPLATTTFDSTGELWVDITTETFTLQEGVYTFELRATDGGFRINYFDFTLVESDE